MRNDRGTPLAFALIASALASRGEFEALKRFGDYEELRDCTLMRMEGDKEFRIYCDDVEKWSFGLITPGFCNMPSEA